MDLVVATALVGLMVAGSAPARSEAETKLQAHCLLLAADPKNPWALAHGIMALGASFAASDGRRAADVIVSDFLRKGPLPEGNPYSFDRHAADGTPIEPHTNLITKTFVLAGMPLSTEFKTRFGTVRLADLVSGVERGFRHVPTSEEYWRDVGWTLDLLSKTRTPARATFRTGDGKSVDFNAVMDDALSALEKAQADIAAGMDQGLPQVDKRKQGIYAHSCGGLHLAQAVFSWARHADVRKRWAARLNRQVDVLFYRVGSEQRQYELALQQSPANFELLILTQMVKFHGHFLETTGRLKRETGFVPTAAQKQIIAKSKAYLDFAVRKLSERKAFESMDSIKRTQPQVYLDLIGDACHAANGASFWR